jgi:hypothetical protein
MVRISALWTRRSTRETTQAALGKTSRHSANGRFNAANTFMQSWTSRNGGAFAFLGRARADDEFHKYFALIWRELDHIADMNGMDTAATAPKTLGNRK